MLSLKPFTGKIGLQILGIILLAGWAVYHINHPGFTPELRRPLIAEDTAGAWEGNIRLSSATTLVQKILYRRCSDEETVSSLAGERLNGLTLHQLQGLYAGWRLEAASPETVYMSLAIDGYCREHANNLFLGIHDDKVTVFCGKPDTKPIVKEVTAIPVSKLMTQDIEELTQGIVINSKEELLRTLEGMQAR